MIGQEINHYKLFLFLGSGSSAHVYLGKHAYDRSYAAIKIMRTQMMSRRMAEWDNETQVLSHISHPHIIPMYAYGVHDEQRFRIMHWAEEGTLRDLFTQCVPLSSVVSYVKQIASVLQYLHDRYLIHRDLKPTNILIGSHDYAWLADFEHAVDYRDCQSPMGTPVYAAPEQRKGRPCPASDQYALGVMVYQWLYGALPRRASFSTKDTELKRSSRMAEGQLPHSIRQVLQVALSPSPDARYASIQAFADAFEQACKTITYTTQPQDSRALSTDSSLHRT